MSIGLGMILATSLSAQPTFSFNVTTFQSGGSGLSQTQFVQAFQEAANLWSSKFVDNVNLNVELQLVNGSFLAGTETTVSNHSYDSVVSAMISDATSIDDALGISNLQAGPDFGLLINRTSQNGDGLTPYFDDNGSFNNSNVQLTDANAMALGFSDPTLTGPDMQIIVGNDPGGLGGLITWDIDRSDGIGLLSLDLVGVAAHELGHGMGFLSSVDILDENTGTTEDDIVPTIPDLFRASAESTAFGVGVFDMSVDDRDKGFALDGQGTSLGLFSTGAINGDGRQASHWKDDVLTGDLVGLMDPTIDLGQLGVISDTDLRVLDVAGWSLAVPEPSSSWIVGSILLVGLCLRRPLRMPGNGSWKTNMSNANRTVSMNQ